MTTVASLVYSVASLLHALNPMDSFSLMLIYYFVCGVSHSSVVTGGGYRHKSHQVTKNSCHKITSASSKEKVERVFKENVDQCFCDSYLLPDLHFNFLAVLLSVMMPY